MCLTGNDENTTTLLKRKRTTVRANITRFITRLSDPKSDNSNEDIEYLIHRLSESLAECELLDDSIHRLFSDDEYKADVVQCQSYTDSAKLAIFKAQKVIQSAVQVNTTSAATSNLILSGPTPVSHSHTVKLPTVKLECFRGDVEEFQRFWEQFTSSVDSNPNLSVIDKHVFLRGYLEDEPKRLVDGISIIADTYETTKKLLMDRYGDKNRIIQAHLDFLENIPRTRNFTPFALNEIFIECNRRIQALSALGENVNAYGRVLTPKILRAFPDDICRRWIIYAKRQKISEGDITKLQEFLAEEVEGALTTQKIKGESAFDFSLNSSAAALNVNSKTVNRFKKPSPFCPFCDTRGHWPQDCTIVTDIDTRIQKLKCAGRCFLCTNRGHNQKNCTRKEKAFCSKCKRKHHVSICRGVNASQVSSSSNTSTNQIGVFQPNFTHLQTAKIYITGPTGLTKITRCILDGGSQSSFVHSRLVDALKLPIISSDTLQVRAFECLSSNTQPRRRVQFELSSIWNKSKVCVHAFESINTYAYHPTAPSDVALLSRKHKLKLADPQDTLQDIPIEVLIGADYYWSVVNSKTPIQLSESLVLIPSIFGWILSGCRSNTTSTVHSFNTQVTTLSMDEEIRKYWDLETIGIRVNQDREMTAHNAAILKCFHDSYEITDGRRVVRLPWKQGVTLTSNNYSTAEKRLNTLHKKLSTNKELEKVYIQGMQDYIDRNQVEYVSNTRDSNSKVYYLPHHAVKKEKNGETKWRIVFDASSHTQGNPSLNDALEQGPNLLPDILAALLRFRLHKQAVTSDGSQAFLQLILSEKDRNATRFLWFKTVSQPNGTKTLTDEVLTYRFARLPFGLSSSPFLLSATLRELANMHIQTYPIAAKQLLQNTFMDDLIMGVDTEDEAIMLYHDIQNLMSLISLPLAKWSTNSPKLQGIWIEENTGFKKETQVLGVNWNTHDDTFHQNIQHSVHHLQLHPATKRLLLQSVSKFYDPLGLFAPATVVGKILFQDTWLLGVQWDEILPPDIATRWHRWTSELPVLNEIQIPRWIGASSLSNIFIHVFCDSSERAYGAVLYVTFTDIHVKKVRLACSRNRLSPLKKLTLPRLELLAALIGARLLHYFCKETHLDCGAATLWSDSTVTLGWIRGDPSRWKTFVCNRITEIHQYTSPAQWRHCPGPQNPADYLSRGISPAELFSTHLWFEGPVWLTQPENTWPAKSLPTNDHSSVVSEARKIKAQSLYTTTFHPVIDASRFSSYIKLLRVTAWIFRFVNNCKPQQRQSSDLTAAELKKAKDYWIYSVQKECFPVEMEALQNDSPLHAKSKIARFNPFLQDNLLRLGGRLQFAPMSYAQRHPLLLDGSHHFVRLLIHYTHIRLHHLGVRIVLSELRSTYWILRGRESIKRVIRNCLPCKLSQAPRGSQTEAPLPPDRITPCKPFATTGIDFAGPVYARKMNTSTPMYIALFTCSTTRALHIELVSDLTTDKFLMALQRFVGRRGLPQTIYTDNATTFHAANKELVSLWNTITDKRIQQFYAQNGITWKFIVPRAAWWGGWWERLIGLTKRCLRKSLGRALLDEEALSTALIGVEAALNSRPLVYEQGNEDSEEVLTPAHFLTGEKLTTLPPGADSKQVKLTRIYRMQQDLLDTFWKKWSKEYLMELRSYHQVRSVHKLVTIRKGDIVLLQEDVRPRHTWKRALVIRVIEGRDGKCRSCVLRVDGKETTRPVQLVIPLEVDQGGEDVPSSV